MPETKVSWTSKNFTEMENQLEEAESKHHSCRCYYILIALALYVNLGGIIFMYLEQPHHEELCKNAPDIVKNMTQHLLEDHGFILNF